MTAVNSTRIAPEFNPSVRREFTAGHQNPAPAWSQSPVAAPTEFLRPPGDADPSGTALQASRSTGLTSKIDQGRFWVGAVLAAAAAALTGVVAMIVAQGILGIPVLFGGSSSVDLVHISSYGLIAAAAALVVAAVYDAMIHFAPRPGTFFGWLGGLATLLVALLPFTSAAPLQSQLVLGAMNLMVGAVILVLVPAAAVSARRR